MVVVLEQSWSMSRKSEDGEEKTPNVLRERFIYLTFLYYCFKDLIKSRYFSFLRDMLVWRLVSKPTASSKMYKHLLWKCNSRSGLRLSPVITEGSKKPGKSAYSATFVTL